MLIISVHVEDITPPPSKGLFLFCKMYTISIRGKKISENETAMLRIICMKCKYKNRAKP